MRSVIDRLPEPPPGRERASYRPHAKPVKAKAEGFEEILSGKPDVHAADRKQSDAAQESGKECFSSQAATPLPPSSLAVLVKGLDLNLRSSGEGGRSPARRDREDSAHHGESAAGSGPNRRTMDTSANQELPSAKASPFPPSREHASLVREIQVDANEPSQSGLVAEVKEPDPLALSERSTPLETPQTPAAPIPLPIAPQPFVSESPATPSPAKQILSQVRTLASEMLHEQPILPEARAMQMRLHPANLGDVHVTLRISGGALAVVIRPTTVDAAASLSRDAAALEDVLGQIAGLTAASVTIVASAAPAEQASFQQQPGNAETGASLSQGRSRHDEQAGHKHHDDSDVPVREASAARQQHGVAGDGRVV